MTDMPIAFAQLEERLLLNPFHRWLGLRLVGMGPDTVEIAAAWRPEWVSNPERGFVHGGILAALVDTAADFALAAKLGRPYPTVDMRVDYHRGAGPGDLTAKGRVIRAGGTFSTAEASIHDRDGTLLASGRGVYYSGLGKA
ncbi:MAG: PaaI family thioesterase [Alphaproteobacteria bacterium]